MKKDASEIVSEITSSMLEEKVHKAIEEKINDLINENKNLKESVKEYKDKYLYALADFDNLRKRFKKEKEEISEFTKEYLFLKLLPIVDNFERAIKAMKTSPSDPNEILSGIKMIYNQLVQFLNSEGVEGYESVGKEFDPRLHEAIEVKEDTSIPNNIILEEFVKGYKFKDKIIRPAKVSVNIIKKEVEYERTDNRD